MAIIILAGDHPSESVRVRHSPLASENLTLNSVMAITLRYLTEFGKRAFQHNRVICGGIFCTSLLYFVVRVRCRRKESSLSLSHLLMSFLLLFTGRSF